MTWTKEMFASPGDDAGVFADDFCRALLTWVAMQDREGVTVAEAALAFNTTPDVIREGIEEGYWTSWHGPDDDPTKQIIELDGE
jgi:hypothetical protein